VPDFLGKTKGSEKAVINCTFGDDDSIYITDLIKNQLPDSEYEIVTYKLPINKVGMSQTITLDGPRFITDKQLKFSHHTSGDFHISGLNVNSKLVKSDSFNLNKSTNDGGPFIAGMFWGLNYLPDKNKTSSTKLVFTSKEIDYQSMNNPGEKLAFTLLFFHIQTDKVECLNNEEWAYYNYHHYKKPLLLRIIRPHKYSNYIVGISCLKSRTNMNTDFGFTLGGGADQIDPKTKTCKNISIIFPKQGNNDDLDYISLNYNQI